MRSYNWIILISTLFLFWQCQTEQQKGFLIRGEISGGEGKYIKIIDMTMPGLGIDSMELDLAGRFSFGKVINEPNDYVLYFKPEQSIRITPLPEEQIQITGKYSNLLGTYSVQGSEDSEQISRLLKRQTTFITELDSVKAFYMRNQLHPNMDSIVELSRFRSDSIFKTGKKELVNQIKSEPGSMASYVALSQKLSPDLPYFNIQNDYNYFYMVDTALTNRFDTATVVNMLHGYVVRAKQLNALNKREKGLKIGDTVPEIALPNPAGDTLLLTSLRGKYVLIDFWGSWCRPCRLEHPNLRKAYWRYRKRGFDVFQVALEHSADNWKNTLREDKLYWKNQVSELRYMDSEVARKYKIKSIPANFLIDKEGKLIAKNLYGEELLIKLEELMPYRKPAPTPVTTETAKSE